MGGEGGHGHRGDAGVEEVLKAGAGKGVGGSPGGHKRPQHQPLLPQAGPCRGILWFCFFSADLWFVSYPEFRVVAFSVWGQDATTTERSPKPPQLTGRRPQTSSAA